MNEWVRQSQDRLAVAAMLALSLLHIALVPSDAAAAAPTPAGQFPAELEVLAAGWENNVNRISSIQAHMKVQIHHYQDIATDLDGKKYQDQLVDTFLWKQGTLSREDRSFNYTFAGEGQVEYQIPFGEHTMPKAEYDETRMKRTHGTIATTLRVLGRDGVKYDYCDEGKTCSITRGFTYEDFSRASRWLASGGVFFGDTLKELVDGARQTPPPRCSVEDMGEGLYRVTLGGDTWSTVCTIDSRRGCTVRSIKHTQDSGGGMFVLYEAEYSYIDSGGIWVMAEGKQTVYRPKTGELDYSWAVQLDPDSLKLNEPIDPEVFTLDGFKMRKGTYIVNMITGEESLYNDIPLDLKIALSAAKRDQDKLPAEFDHVSTAPTPGSASTRQEIDPCHDNGPKSAVASAPHKPTPLRPNVVLPAAVAVAAVAAIAVALLVMRYRRRGS